MAQPLVHHLGLALGEEVLGDVAHDAQQFALPILQPGRELLEEIQQVLLWQAERQGLGVDLFDRVVAALAGRQGAP